MQPFLHWVKIKQNLTIDQKKTKKQNFTDVENSSFSYIKIRTKMSKKPAVSRLIYIPKEKYEPTMIHGLWKYKARLLFSDQEHCFLLSFAL